MLTKKCYTIWLCSQWKYLHTYKTLAETKDIVYDILMNERKPLEWVSVRVSLACHSTEKCVQSSTIIRRSVIRELMSSLQKPPHLIGKLLLFASCSLQCTKRNQLTFISAYLYALHAFNFILAHTQKQNKNKMDYTYKNAVFDFIFKTAVVVAHNVIQCTSTVQ